MQISQEQLQPIKKLYDQSLYLKAYEKALQLAPLNQWVGADAMLLAGRIAGNLGAPKLARRLHLRAWREHRDHPEATYYYARALLELRGPWRAWMFIRGIDELSSEDPVLQSDWLGLRAALMATLRDFDAADELIARAEKLAPQNPWLWVEKSTVFQCDDRYDKALEAARTALRLNSDY